jgi:GTPase SAR1 family protein
LDRTRIHFSVFHHLTSFIGKNPENTHPNFANQRERERDNIPSVLVGNKCDLTSDREVSTEEGMNLAKNWNCPFLETSAKVGINVEECLFQLVREIRQNIEKERKHNHKHSNCEVM